MKNNSLLIYIGFLIVGILSILLPDIINKEQEIVIYEQNPNKEVEESVDEEPVEEIIVYDNMTLEQLSNKLNMSLNSTIANKGELIASKSLELGIDPYLATAIILHETGCKWECSYLVKACNNVGGQKGSPACNGGSYKRFDSLDEGIIGFLNNLYNNYYQYGLNTPELMNNKYAESTTWASKINNYIESIKAK